jgi:hypothetical protein
MPRGFLNKAQKLKLVSTAKEEAEKTVHVSVDQFSVKNQVRK